MQNPASDMHEQVQQFIQQAGQAVQAGQFAQALDLVDQAIQLDPTSADAYSLRGVALAQSHQPDAATAAFRQAIQLGPSNPKAYYNLATHLYQRGGRAEAKQMAEEALRLEPTHAQARELLGTIQRDEEASAMPAPPSAGSPYGGPAPIPPYGAPQSPFRPGYVQPGGSIAFVENMGSTWTAIGWALSLIYLAIAIWSIVVVAPLLGNMFQPGADPTTVQEQMVQKMGGVGVQLVVQILSILTWIGIIVWTIMDIANRRGKWLWIVPVVVCSCCSLASIPHITYMLAGRKRD